MKRIIVLLGVILVWNNVSIAQSWQWGRRGGGGCGLSCNRDEDIKDMQCDANGNIYFLARLDGGGDENLQTGNGDSADIGTLKGGVPGALLASYNSCGKLRWKKVFYCSNGEVRPTAMSIDTLGHINVVVESDADFHCDIDSFTANTKRKTIAIIQYDTLGKFKWLRQPNSDTAGVITNLSKNRVFGIYSMPDGDIYAFCGLSPGLISGSSSLVVSSNDYHMLKYSSAGVPKELIKLDINLNGSLFDSWNFSVTKSRKFIFNFKKTTSTAYTATSPLVGGQPARNRLFLCCFNTNGSLAWRFTDTDTIGGYFGRPYVDEITGNIYSAGVVKGFGTPDTIGGIAITNPYNVTALPILVSVDTNGIFKWANWSNNFIGSGLNRNSSVAKLSGNRVCTIGTGYSVNWGSVIYKGPGLYLASFNASNGNLLGIDSLAGSSSPIGDVITTDKNDNVYVGGRIYSDITVAGNYLQSYGGLNDFFVAKFGSDCSVMPLTITNYELKIKNQKQVENLWTTANEINVNHYNIQRSTNSRDFTTIGTLKANNKSYNEYSFTDDKLPTTLDQQTIYYRIQAVDKDGTKTYSAIKSLTINNSPLAINIYPNPTKDVVTISSKEAISKLVVIDYLGRNVYEQITSFQAMTNNTNLLSFNINHYPKGLYVVRVVTNSGKVFAQKLQVE